MTNNIETPLIEYLNRQQINFRLLPHKTPAISIVDAAAQRGIRSEQMVKSILLRDMGNQYALACCPGNLVVDPKKVRTLLQFRRMTCADLESIYEITGYPVGCVTPLQLKTPMPILFDHHILDEELVTISSGNTMAGIELQRSDLVLHCRPIIGNICRA